MSITTNEEVIALVTFVEGLLYGNISVLCALTCTLTKEVQLFPGLGIYSGLFAIYLQCSSKESRMATVIFYALCVPCVLSTAAVVIDFLAFTFEVCKKIYL